MYRQLRGDSTEWNAIGRELGVSHNDREKLRKRIELSDDDRLEMVLIKWKKSECTDVSWDTIIDMLKDLKLNNVAREVTQYLLTDRKAIKMYGWKEK